MSPDDVRRATHRELVEEAERRGIANAEWMEREVLVRALSEEGDRALSALARARRFFGRVTGLGRVAATVRSAVEPPRPPDVSLVPRAREPLVEAQTASRIDEPRQLEGDPLLVDPSFSGLRSVTRAGKTWLVWRADAVRLVAAGSKDAELTLRTVSIACAFGELDADVTVTTHDLPGMRREGAHSLGGATGGARPNVVAAIGLGTGERFVALAHTRVL